MGSKFKPGMRVSYSTSDGKRGFGVVSPTTPFATNGREYYIPIDQGRNDVWYVHEHCVRPVNIGEF